MLQRDSRYDVLLIDSPDGQTAIETLPLLLRERSGGLDWGISLVSSFANQLPAGDMQDNDNTRYSVRTQRDWRGGIGQEYAYQETDAFHQSLADTRFRNGVILPPKPQATSISGSSDPQFTPAQAGVSVTTKRAKAEWVKGSRVDGEAAASAAWTNLNTSNATSDAKMEWTGRSLGYGNDASAIATLLLSGDTRAATSFTTGSVVSAISSIVITLNQTAGAGFTSNLRVGIQADSAGSPSGTWLAYGDYDLSIAPNNIKSPLGFSVSYTPAANTTYWVVVHLTSGGATVVQIFGNTSSTTGAGKLYTSGSVWTSQSWNIYCTLGTTYDKAQTRLAQRILAPASVSATQIKVPISASVWAGSPTLTARLMSDSAGAPNATLKSTTTTNPGTSIVWVTFTITSQSITAATYYWIVIEVDGSTSADYATVQWQRDANANYSDGSGGSQTASNSGSWSAVGAITGDFYFVLNTGYAGSFPFFNGTKITKTRVAQSITGNGSYSVTTILVPLRSTVWAGSPTVTLKLCSDSAGSPGTVLKSATTTNPGAGTVWVTFTITSQALSNATVYWLVLEVDGGTNADYATIAWQKDTVNNYAGGAAYTQTATNAGAWSTVSANGGDCYFVVGTLGGNGITYYSHDYNRTLWAESITPAATVNLTRLRIYAQQISRAGSATVQLVIAQNSGGSPGTTIVTATLTSAMFSTAALAWVDIPIATTLNSGTVYWIYIDCNAASVSDGVQIDVGADSAGGYAGTCKYVNVANYVAGSWTTDTTDLFFIINNGTATASTVTTQPVVFKNAMYMASDTGVYRFGEILNSNTSFENSLTGWGLDQNGSSTTSYVTTESIKGRYSLKVSRVGGTKCILYITSPYLTAAAGQVITASVWFKMLTNTSGTPPAVGMIFRDGGGVQLTSSFGAGVVSNDWQQVEFTATAPASTATVSMTIYVQETNQEILVDDARLVRSEWVLKNNCGNRVTALQAFAGKIYAALGDSTNMVESSDGNTWADTSGNRQYTHLRAYNGYLYAAKATGGANSLAYTDGTSWVTNLQIATAEHAVTGLAGFNNELIIATTRALFSLSSSYVYQIIDYTNEEDENNGANMLTWMVNNALYVPIKNGLNAYDGARMTASGPDQNEGLPNGEQGRIAAMCGSKTWLFAAIDAGGAGTSSIYAFNGTGWHCLAKATNPGKRIRAIGIETVTSPKNWARLWWFEDSTPFYVEFPSLTDNPYAYTGVQYAATGFVTSSRFGGELSLIVKDFQSIFLWTDGCSAGQNVQVYYEIDNTGIWVLAGTCTQSPSQEFRLTPQAMANKTVGSGSTTSTINIAGLTSDMAVGQFVRINGEIAQVSAITSNTQFTLAIPLTAAPESGDTVYTSGPAGRQIRYRITLNTNDASKTPKVVRVALRIQPLFTAKARISFGPRVEDELLCRNNTAYPYDAVTLRNKLFEWFQRVKPYYLIDPYGRAWQVKNNSATESALTRQDEAPKQQRFKTYISAVVDEV